MNYSDPALWSRFFSKVDSRGGDCWRWKADRDGNRYGRFKLDGRKVQAHRVAYEMLIGPIPDGLTLDHLCCNPRCVQPLHLEPVTQRENTLRGDGVAAINARKTHCANDHPFDRANTYVRADGRRNCRACQRDWKRQHKATLAP